MKAIVCSSCGSNEFKQKDGHRVCVYCGTVFQLTSDDKAIKSSTISMGSDVEKLLEKCRRDPKRARRYANLILDIDPTNTEAKKYL